MKNKETFSGAAEKEVVILFPLTYTLEHVTQPHQGPVNKGWEMNSVVLNSQPTPLTI